tara:strand:- start:6 stop:227 length:222 start_codon:yes stop_codon:yes gene_type:complete
MDCHRSPISGDTLAMNPHPPINHKDDVIEKHSCRNGVAISLPSGRWVVVPAFDVEAEYYSTKANMESVWRRKA